MLKPESTAMTLLLAALVALGPLSTDMYLAALPTLTGVFAAGVDRIQLTLSVFLVGFACAQLVYGPLSDRFGRRPAILGGMALFTLASLGCAFASSVEELIVYRFLQAVGGSAGPVLGRAVVRDIHGREHAARVLSHIGSAMALAPAIAPLLGGYLLVWFGWHSIFVSLAAYGAVMMALVALRVGESNRQPDPHAFRPGRMLGNYAQLLRDGRFLGYTLAASLVYSGLFAFISGSSFVVIDHFGYPAEAFGWFFAAGAPLGYVLGTLAGGRLSLRLGVDRLLIRGAWLAALGGGAMLALHLAGVDHVAAVVAPMVVFMTGVGIVMPQAMAGAIGPYPRMAGAASALFGFVQMALAASAGVAVGHLHDGTPLPMVACIAAAGASTLLAYWLLVWRRR